MNVFTDAHRGIDVSRNQESHYEAFDPNRRIDVSRIGKTVESVYSPDVRIGKLYTEREDRIDVASRTKCEWCGDAGDSRAIPITDAPEGRAAAERLAEFGQRDVSYRDGVVDFGPCSLEAVQIEGMTKNRMKDGDDCGNFKRAYDALAEKWNREKPKDDGSSWTAQEIKVWANAENLTVHECSDMKTVQFVPREIHSFFKHFGGVAECKAREKQEETS